MSNNVAIPTTVGGQTTTIETIDEGGGVERQVFVLGSIGDASGETQLSAGQKTSANSIPVVVASDQSAVPVMGTFYPATQPVSGTVTANAGTNLNTSTLALETGGNLATLAGTVASSKVKVDPSGVTSPVSLASLPALPAGTNAIGSVFMAPTASSSFAITPGSSSALEASHVLKASAGNLYSLYVATTTASGWLLTFNATSAPADGAVTPVEAIQIPAASAAAISFDGSPPDYYSTGIVAVFSTTGPFTKTASATAFFKWRVE